MKGQSTHPQVEHFLWCLQNIDKQTEQTYPMSMVFLWQKHLYGPQISDMGKEMEKKHKWACGKRMHLKNTCKMIGVPRRQQS